MFFTESTSNFTAALRDAHVRQVAAGKAQGKQLRVMGALFTSDPTSTGNLRRAHREVRRLYLRKTGKRFAFRLDWAKLVDWLIEHWDDILKIVMTILPLVV